MATTYTVTCQGEFSGGAIVKLKEMGMYRVRVAPGRYDEDETRHRLQVEAGSAEDAILRAKGAVAVAGGKARDYQATEGAAEDAEPDGPPETEGPQAGAPEA
ncbi:MAG: hypothetical protein R2725_10715 [Solirubrobacterales bacterium]